MNYLIYPTKSVRITQNHTEGNHAAHSVGKYTDYPIDEAGADSGRDWFYCPCDEMRIVRIYGVGTRGVNTVWLTSVKPVIMPCGVEYVTIMVEHSEDEDLKRLQAGQTFRRGQKMFREGKDGNATGNHFHIAVASGKPNGNGWAQNEGGAWVLCTTGKPIAADKAFYLDGQRVQKAAGYIFKNKPKEIQTMQKTDNTPDSYAKAAVSWAIQNKILRGSDGNYMLHSPVTRQDMLVFLHRAIGA